MLMCMAPAHIQVATFIENVFPLKFFASADKSYMNDVAKLSNSSSKILCSVCVI